MSDDAKTIRAGFRGAVTMTARELTAWLETDESTTVGEKEDGAEWTGHRPGHRIVDLLGTKRGDLAADDPADMPKATCYVRRHLARRPDGDVEETPWRYGLLNRGHAPEKR